MVPLGARGNYNFTFSCPSRQGNLRLDMKHDYNYLLYKLPFVSYHSSSNVAMHHVRDAIISLIMVFKCIIIIL